MEEQVKRSDIDDVHVIALAQRWAMDHHLLQGRRIPGVVQALINEGVPAKLAYAKVEHLVDRGLLDCGTSSRLSWPTPEGLALLRATA